MRESVRAAATAALLAPLPATATAAFFAVFVAGMIVAFATATFVVVLSMAFTATAFVIVGVVRATAAFVLDFCRTVIMTATAAATFLRWAEARQRLKFASAELGQHFSDRAGLDAENVHAVLLQLDEQARVDFVAENAFDTADDFVADLLRAVAVDGMESVAIAIEDDQVLRGAEIGFDHGGEAFGGCDGDTEFHGVSFRA
ncbi:hypothetical protein GCM10027046_01310 [Uliginosibacterium flavum]